MLKSAKDFLLSIFSCIFALLKNDKEINNIAEKLNGQERSQGAILLVTEIISSNLIAAAYLRDTKENGASQIGQMGFMVNKATLRSLR